MSALSGFMWVSIAWQQNLRKIHCLLRCLNYLLKPGGMNPGLRPACSALQNQLLSLWNMELFIKKSKQLFQEGLTLSHCGITISRLVRNLIWGKGALEFGLNPGKEAYIWVLQISSECPKCCIPASLHFRCLFLCDCKGFKIGKVT